MVSNPLTQEQVWVDKFRVEDAETSFYERQSGVASGCPSTESVGSSLVNEIARARQHIKNALNQEVSVSGTEGSLLQKIQSLEKENQELRQVTQNLSALVKNMVERVTALEKGAVNAVAKPEAASAPAAAPAKEESDEDDFDLFGEEQEEDEEEAERVKAERIAAYSAKKSKKPALVAKSSLLIDVKPWDDETDMKKMEELVRSIQMDGLLWGASKLAPVGYGIKKLVMNAVIEDDKVSTDDLEEKIVAFEDYVQSMDIAAFNKI
ncbi:hypothetical protein CAPTEDRAFT_228652 [Capitella teleta]|uniref:Translation elongation factor EF1B beta/delta subunit guanine nucleotide exchange domain-containing protein n=1 Tax=Capitella teleta TaxID=283909 RepID=R7VI90_CAPTE|nr:hypothetical protein CAPTEDRAFT_228652 [Capitella teleta]|eukprot:ELU18563.1 hypothetical protein CAPTEDRAFT_228652 [Capitella teleta]